MFGKAKNFMMRKMLERQLKNASPQEREMIMTLMDKDPELMEKIAKDIKAEMKGGKDQMAAAMKVMPKYQKELQEALGANLPQQNGGTTRFNPNGSIRR